MDLAGGATRGCVRAHERARARMPRMPRCRRALFAAVRTDARTRCHHADTFLKAREWKNKISYAERRQVARVVGRQYRSASPGGSTVSERRRALQVGWADWRLSTTGGLDWLDWQLNTTGGLGWLTAEHYRRAGLTDSWTLQAGWADWQLNTTGRLGWMTAERYRRAGLTNSWTLQVDLLDRQLSTTGVLGWLDRQLTAEHYRWAGLPWLTAEHYRRADLTDSRALQAGWTDLTDSRELQVGCCMLLLLRPCLYAPGSAPLSLRSWPCARLLVSTPLAPHPWPCTSAPPSPRPWPCDPLSAPGPSAPQSLDLYTPGPAPLRPPAPLPPSPRPSAPRPPRPGLSPVVRPAALQQQYRLPLSTGHSRAGC